VLTPIAISFPGALAVVGVAIVGFIVVLAVCFVVLRLISFVTSGADDDLAASEEAAAANEEGPPAADEEPAGKDSAADKTG
jgi:flagellar biosynthesis/type III secretory pathway M-ring protein FliF/YscJ